MRKMIARRMIGVALVALAAAPALAALKDEPDIRERILTVGEAEELSKRCGSVDARRAVGLSYLIATARMAMAKGYSRSEIEAYVENDAEKERLRGIVRERLAAKGAVRGDEASHCRIARAEIARRSEIGRMLR